MRTSTLFATALIFLFGTVVQSQNIDWQVHNLPNATTITALHIDVQANVWAGTPEGAYKLVENEWEHYTTSESLPDNDVQAFANGKDGTVWIGTKNGIAQVSPTGEITTVFSSSLEDTDITAIFGVPDDIGTMLFGTANGKIYGHQEGLTAPTEIPISAAQLGKVTSIGSLFSAQYGFIFIFRSTAGIVLSTVDFQTQIPINTTSSSLIPSNNVISGTESVNGVAYDGTDAGLYIAGFDGSGFRTENEGLPDLRVQALAIQEAILWVGTPKGLARKESSAVSTVYTKENSTLPSSDIRAITVDESNRIWVGTADGKVSVGDLSSSVAENRRQNAIKVVVAPNPASQYLLVTAQTERTIKADIVITSLSGESVRRINNVLIEGGKEEEIRIGVEDLPSGQYFCTVYFGDQKHTAPVVLLQ